MSKYAFYLEDEDQAKEFADYVDFYGKQLPVTVDGGFIKFDQDVWNFLVTQGEDAEWCAEDYLGKPALRHDVVIYTRPGRIG